ncbi:peptidoglycan D,D-transpeptidase FtsI family protein [Sporichthya polymorpha]|uniref:peptidoglycan D,D-transpeptidase FtsI family protein n=1 Tax=Sporichthya polymorpha TaxID=35751 RepID=UPI0003A6937B|nr:penicillin-binding protein 2 [Sporichthya polymorpha]
MTGRREPPARRGAAARKPAPRKSAPRQSAPRQPAARRPAATGPRRPLPPRRGTKLGNPGRRLQAALLCLSLVVALLIGRLLQVQGFEASSYAAVAQNERLRTVAVPATRGVIFDRDGDVLARSVEARTVTADPTLISDPRAYAHVLAPKLGVDEEWLAARLGDRPRRYVVLARNIDPDRWRDIAATLDPGTGKPVMGIFAEVTSKRVYPADTLAANILGFLNASGQAGGGIEREFDALLSGVDGEQTYERSSNGGKIATAGMRNREPVSGQDLQLTIDRDIQYAAQQAIAAKVRETRAQSGTVIVQDVKTGEILAMATAPTFNPNNPGKGSDDNRGNRALSQIYEPGSIMKALTMAALIEQGVVKPTDKFKVPGELRRAGHVLHDSDPHGTERWTLAGILAKSSNIGTVLAADKVSAQVLHDYFKAFGVAEPTGLQFPGESRGLLPSVEKWVGTTRYTIPFGQGYSMNTVQAASVYQAIGNGGVRIAPTLVRSWTDADGVTHTPQPPEVRPVVSAATAATVTKMLEQVTAPGGTAPHVKIDGYRIAGKTGTAQFADSECRCYRGYTASFAGFAPADDPRIVVSVTLQKPVRGHYGGMLGGPVFVDVMTFTLRTMGIRPTGAKPARLPLTW